MDYRGHDPIPIVVGNYFYHSRKKENARILNSFEHQIDFHSILEDAVVFCALRTQYENHSVRHYVVTRTDGIRFYPLDEVSGHRQALRDSKKYCKVMHEYPRIESIRKINCTCVSGIRVCPNCRKSMTVSCLQCHQRRSGKCGRCSGGGRLVCNACGGGKEVVKQHSNTSNPSDC